MDFSYSEDQQALRELARKILEERATHDRLKEVRKTAERVDLELWRELAKSNLLGIAIPDAFGDTGTGLPELMILLEEIGRTVAPLPAMRSDSSIASITAPASQRSVRWMGRPR